MDHYCLLPSPVSNRCESDMITAAELASPKATIVPLLLLGTVAVLSFSFRFSHTLDLSKPTRKTVIAIHAFATEGVQLLLAVNAFINTALLFAAIARASLLYHDNAALKITLELTILASGLLAGNIFAVYAVDLIEGWILSRTLLHPYKWRCFILTRTLLIQPKRHVTVRFVRKRVRALSEPPTSHLNVFPVAIDMYGRRRETLTVLAYLDLASGKYGQRPRTAFCSSHNLSSFRPGLARRNTIQLGRCVQITPSGMGESPAQCRRRLSLP